MDVTPRAFPRAGGPNRHRHGLTRARGGKATDVTTILTRMRSSMALAAGQPAVAGRTGHRPWPLPAAPWVLAQTWQDTAFLHWPVDPGPLRAAMPDDVVLDTREGAAWLTVTPLTIRASRPRGVPPVFPWSDFHELNLRTYARVGDRPGIWFFSLDAQSVVSVVLARLVYHLPYRRARIAIGRAGDEGWVRSRRRDHPPASFAARHRAAGEPAPAPAGSLDHWLLERYCCYGSDGRGGVWRTDIHHPPWRVRPCAATVEHDTLARPLGAEGPPARVHLADRQDVLFWPPRRCGRGSG